MTEAVIWKLSGAGACVPRYRTPSTRTYNEVKRLEAALWAFHDAQDFREAVLKAVNLGDDADTTGAVCGQSAGACWGESGIPAEWLEGLARKDMIEKALSGLLHQAG